MRRTIHTEKSRIRRSRISSKLLIQYMIAMAGFVFGIFLLILIAWNFCHMFIWYDTNPIYHILSFIRDRIIFFVGAIILIGWGFLTYYFITKPLAYIDEVVDAAKTLASPSENEITLSKDMNEIEVELNAIRVKALNAMAAQKEAEQRKNDLIVYLAHDLKTPLTSVIGYLNLLYDQPNLSIEQRAKYTDIAYKKAERLEELINEFFDITRFNMSQLTLEKKDINLSRMLEQLTYEFQPVLDSKGLTFQTRIEPDIHILCDTDKLERVFDNLIRNAVNYCYENTSIELSMITKYNQIVITFQNDGDTIPSDKLDHIFEQFFRLDSARSGATGGAGLGLAIAKEIVRLHSGEITATSSENKITFILCFPYENQQILS